MKPTAALPLSLALAALLTSTALSQLENLPILPNLPPDADDSPPRRPIVADKELLILDPAVVDSDRSEYPGAFSIGHLFDEMAGETGDGRALMREWLESWQVSQVVNGDLVAARERIRESIVEPWMEADGYDPNSDGPWMPDFYNAPFRLLGIVNRLDLHSLSAVYYGSDGSSAEGRLVYAALDSQGKPLGHHFTIIFEYQLLDARARNKKQVARAWHALGDHADFDEEYLEALETLTRQFTDRGVDDKGGEAPSRLAQVRTNEMVLAPTCEMREFKLSAKTQLLELAPVAQTPRAAFMRRATPENRAMHGYLVKNASAITAGRRTLPLTIPGERGGKLKFLAGSCSVPNPDFYWETGGVGTRELRQVFSLRTCNGCHARDTGTSFCHIRPRMPGKASEVSEFLAMNYKGHTVDDPGQYGEKVTTTEMRSRIEDFLKSIHMQINQRELRRLARESF